MKEKILIVSPVLLREVDGQLGLDDQTCEDLVQWTENFEQVIFACPTLPEYMVESSASVAGTNWQPIADLACKDRLELLPLPCAYKIQDFIKTYTATRQILKTKIQECQYLCFSVSGLIGDWAGIACLEAIKLRLPYAVSTDRVEHEVIRRTLLSLPLKRRVKEYLTLPLMKYYQRYLIQQSNLGMFPGQDCYSAYSPFCKQPHCVYNVHTKKSDQIDEASIDLKIESLLYGNGPLRICYVGRAADMKSPFDWLHAVHRVYKAGVDLQATWVGHGPLLLKMKSLAQELGIADRVHLVGFVSDRSKILQTMREHHIFLFCHKTPESPRCLIESLVSGCPIVGYSSPYPQGLISQCGGGVFAPMNDWRKLADQVIELNSDRARLSKLTRSAAQSGQFFDEETVFQARSNLIKKYLGESCFLDVSQNSLLASTN